MKPLRAPGDGARAAKAGLAAYVPSLVAAPAPTVSLNLPGDWSADSATHVGVFDDGGPVIWPVATKTRIRVTVWDARRTRAREVAGVCLGVLLAYRITGLGAVSDPTPLLEDRDGNGAVAVSFTVAATVRTVPVQ